MPSLRPTHGNAGEQAGSELDMRRRDALKFLASGLALTLAGCSAPKRKILPYVDMPEGLVAGEPAFYATALPLAGYARGVIVEAVDGRPIKIAGNPRHPASLGATDIFAEAEILSLYDPDRSRAVRGPEPVSTWNAFLGALEPRVDAWKRNGGEGVRLVTGRVTSPTMRRQIEAFLKANPAARWHAYEPAEGDLADLPERAVPDLASTKIIVALDADPLGPGPDQIVNARGFAQGRKPDAQGGVSRLYVVESTRTLTGANADHRLALHPRHIALFATALADGAAGGKADTGDMPPEANKLLQAVLADIEAHGDAAVVLAGDTLPRAAREAVATIGASPAGQPPATGTRPTPLGDLWTALGAGGVTDLIIIGRNPVHDFPDADIEKALSRVPFSLHAGTHQNETARVAKWHLPMSHVLESWGDLAARDGTVSIVQPLIRPLYSTRSDIEILGLMSGAFDPSDHDMVRATWRGGRSDAAFETWWREALIAGVVDDRGTHATGADASAPSPSSSGDDEAEAKSPLSAPGPFVAIIRPDPTIHDGTFSNNAWLQECPKPITKHTWSNVVTLSPDDAGRIGVADGDLVSVRSKEGVLEGPVHVDAGQAAGVVGLTLGYGRTLAGAIGDGLGYNARALAPRRLANRVEGIAVTAIGERTGSLDTGPFQARRRFRDADAPGDG